MCASCATSSRAGFGRSGREPRTSGDAELSPVDRRHPQGAARAAENAITAATARSMRRAESLCSFTIRCPRESLRTTALPTCRARSGSPEWVNARLNTASPNRWGDCEDSSTGRSSWARSCEAPGQRMADRITGFRSICLCDNALPPPMGGPRPTLHWVAEQLRDQFPAARD
jgi:hypothetical protein